jgi:hypothetical protein
MKKTKVSLVILGVISALGMTPMLALAGPATGQQQEKPEKTKAFNGKVEAIDASAKTLTVGGNAIYIADATKLTKNDKAITLNQIVVGDEVHGTARQTFDGKTEAITVKVGPMKEKGKESK